MGQSKSVAFVALLAMCCLFAYRFGESSGREAAMHESATSQVQLDQMVRRMSAQLLEQVPGDDAPPTPSAAAGGNTPAHALPPPSASSLMVRAER